MIRDNLKNKVYFDEYIAYEKARIKKFEEVGKTIPADQKERYFQCLRYVASFKRNLISAMYSAGFAKLEIDKEVRSYLQLISKIGPSNYSEDIDALSMAVLFNVSAGEIKGLISCSDNQDDLISLLKDAVLGRALPEDIGKNLLYKNKYNIFVQFLQGKITIDCYKEYIENSWYESNQDAYWFDSHKSKSNTYTGYWCWLAAATLRLMKTPMEYAVMKYVPYELL